ncbi:unnamed protein product [Rhizophagus irregularis]|nr:unnamed protein product [Rhizophagus irregularis]
MLHKVAPCLPQQLNTTLTWLRTGIQRPLSIFERAESKARRRRLENTSQAKLKVTGQDFLDMTEEMLLAPPIFQSLKEMLKKYDIIGNGIGTIRQFPPKTYPLEDEDEELQQCIKEIKRRLGNMGTMLADSNEAMRCEYISAILHASLYIVKRITEKELTLAPQLEVVGEESTDRVDYAIKALEELICITEGKLYQIVMGFAQNLAQCESTLQVNKNKRKRKPGEAFGDDYYYICGIAMAIFLPSGFFQRAKKYNIINITILTKNIIISGKNFPK